MTARFLLVAKAPVAGQAKTRLGAGIGMQAAADLAAAALLDTIAVGNQAFPGRCHLALAGDLADAVAGPELRAAVAGWQVFAQQGETFGERLAHAHRTVAAVDGSAVVQVGMDTPHLQVAALHEAAAGIGAGADAMIGPATDGGWWLLALADPDLARVLVEVPMSRRDTGATTVAALLGAGASVGTVGSLSDVDTPQDAAAVAAAAPHTRFARAWRTGPGRDDREAAS